MKRYNLKVPNTVQNKLEMIRKYREYTSWQSLIIEALNYGATYMLKKIETEIKKAQAVTQEPYHYQKNNSMKPADFERACEIARTPWLDD